VSGQLNATTALPPGKEPLVLIGQEGGWAPEPVWMMWRRKILPLQGLELPPLGRLASRYTDRAIPAIRTCSLFNFRPLYLKQKKIGF
jgi:hypothetical protein